MVRKRAFRRRITFMLVVLLAAVAAPGSATPVVFPAASWTRQFGTAGDEQVAAIAGGATAVYVAGRTDGAIGSPSAGNEDAFVRKYSLTGRAVWTRQFGSSMTDEALATATFGDAVYVAGVTYGTLPGHASAPAGGDAFLRKYDAGGNLLWSRQFGTAAYEHATGLAASADGVFVTGVISGGAFPDAGIAAGGVDAFVRRYNHNGGAVWTRQFGGSEVLLSL